MNDCSRFADCIDKTDGFECRCRSGYYDNNPAQPGRQCTFSRFLEYRVVGHRRIYWFRPLFIV